MDVLMGRTEEDGRPPDFSETKPELEAMADASECDGLLSEDRQAEMRKSLEDFPYGNYGIHVQL